MSTAGEIPPLRVVPLPDPPVPGRNVGDVLAEIRQLRDSAVILDHLRNRILAEFLGSEGDGPPEKVIRFVEEVPHLIDREAVNVLYKEFGQRADGKRRRARALLRGVVTVGPSETVGTPADPTEEEPLLPVSTQGHAPNMRRDQAVENAWQLEWPREHGDGTGRGR